MVTFEVRRLLIILTAELQLIAWKIYLQTDFGQKYSPVKPVVLSVRRKAHEMCLFPTDGRGETTRKLRHDIINSSLSIRLSKSPIHCAFTLEDVIIAFECGLQGWIVRYNDNLS